MAPGDRLLLLGPNWQLSFEIPGSHERPSSYHKPWSEGWSDGQGMSGLGDGRLMLLLGNPLFGHNLSGPKS